MTATKIQPGDDLHLTSLMAPHSLNLVTGADRAALLAYGRDVFAAARASQCLAQPIAGYRISDPSDPTIKPWLSDTPDDNGYTSEPLYAGAAPAAITGCSAPSTDDDRAAFKSYLQECDACGIVADVAGAFNAGWTAANRPPVAAPALEAPAAPAEWQIVENTGMHGHAGGFYVCRKGYAGDQWMQDEKRRIARFATRSQAVAAIAAAAPQAPAGSQSAPVAWASCETLAALDQHRQVNNFPAGGMVLAMQAGNATEPLYTAPQAPAAPSVLPSGWVPCILTHDGQHPEEVAYGPQIMMDRLKKWLGRYFELLAQEAPAAQINPDACSKDIFEKGVSIGLFDIPKDSANAICAGISSVTGARVDWHYIAGRVHIKALAAPAAAPAAPAGDADPLGRRDVGEALMETIERNADALKAVGWLGPMDCPSEIVVDLLNLLEEANATSALGEWVATLEVDSGGGLDYETVPPCTLPAGCYPLYRAAQTAKGEHGNG